MERARRIQRLSSAIFTEMNEHKARVEAKGRKVINLGIGSPDRSPAPHIREALARALTRPGIFGYPTSEGSPELRQTVAHWYQRRFGVELDPVKEVLVLMGSQDGLAHLATAFINPGDVALIPDPGYPIYSAGILLAEGEVYPLPLVAERGFLPDLAAIPGEVARQAKLMVLNYPNNPVAAVADQDFFRQVVDFAREYGIMVCHDAAYSELAFDGFKPMSFLEIPGAKEVGVEFHSLSKSYNLAGCRLGFIVGNAEVLAGLAVVKSNIDYGVFQAVQEAGIAALTGPQECTGENAMVYQRRRDILVEGLDRLDWHIPKPKGSMFLWAPLPWGYTSSKEFALDLLEKAGVLVIPGIAFGKMGDGYVRIALTQEEPLLQETVERIKEAFKY
ncbi:MAG: LL-diaminopimelate aminotransferase [Clostridia bacterium]|nr:LL-diaminopimelate aminotransferase [Clostridia bacterium]